MIYIRERERVWSFQQSSGFGNGALGNVTITSNQQINSYAAVTAINKNKITINNISTGVYDGFTPGQEVMLHISNTDANHKNSFGVYSFHRIVGADSSSVTLNSAPKISSATGLVCQLVTIPNFRNLTVKTSLYSLAYSNSRGGILALKCNGTLDVTAGSLITEGKGLPGSTKVSSITIKNADIVNKLIMNEGNGIVIVFADKVFTTANTRFGATWDGALGPGKGTTIHGAVGGNGGAGYGGGGGQAYDSRMEYPATNANGAKGGYGGTDSSHTANRTDGGMQGYNSKTTGDMSTRGAYSGATVLITANDFVGFVLSCISTGGEGGNYSADGATGGGGGGYCYIDCPSGVPDPPYELAYYVKK